ncbi:hypothetical protein EI546_03505 [Aequorivita sp. H23M31]|uniref:Uncharacterized protein n=1 Tax=Aequorivita ciconiae TaxID=2494375 RepID=A0A410G0T0_9FLAO|nr:hypothetical protein [Aequorivita sp. H23M31]QAA80851.1 hypothetical protein EI546_03505 [Aequorivita sp. H23M31]
MALDKVIAAAKEIGEKVLKETGHRTLNDIKAGKNISEVLKGSIETAKESAFKELDKVLSPESQNELTESAQKLDAVQQKVELDSEAVIENPTEEVKEVNEVTENVNEVAKEISEKLESSFLSEIKDGLEKFKEVLTQIQEIQDKLKELGVSPDLLTMLNAEALEIDEMDDLEEGEGAE